MSVMDNVSNRWIRIAILRMLWRIVPVMSYSRMFWIIHAVGAFSGRILVGRCPENGCFSDKIRNLCATREARMYSKPQLEIYADDVEMFARYDDRAIG